MSAEPMGTRPNSDSKAATDQEDDSSLWTLAGLRWWQLGKRIWVAIDEDDLYNRAYELAYNFLIAVFPLLLFLMALFGMFAGKGVELRSDLLLYVREIVPRVAYQLLRSTLDEVIQSSGGGKLTFGLLLALYAGSTGTTQLITTLNVAHGLRETRSWIKVRLISLALTLVMSLLIIAASLLVLGGGFVAEFLGREIGWSALFVASWKVVQWFVSLAFVLLAFAIVYYFGPDVKTRRWHWITPGSVIGLGLWLAASGALRLYLHFITSFSRSYGSLGAVIILLLWFHVTGLAFLVGAEINSVIAHVSGERWLAKAAPSQIA
jgi:membrane protein